jgi:hypothetical protein
MYWLSAIVALTVGVGSACSANPPAEADGGPDEIVNQAAWVLTNDSALDPFPSHRPVTVMCIPGSVSLETGNVYEIDTGLCNYVVLTQPLLADVNNGNAIDVEFWHFELANFEPATAHVAIAIGGDIVWEIEVSVPHDADSYEARWLAVRDYPAGTPVTIHLHNHGINNYRFLPLTARR